MTENFNAVYLGRAAEECMANDAFRQAGQQVRDALFKEFMSADFTIEGNARADDLRREAKAIEALLSRLSRMADQGKEARRKAEQEEANQSEEDET